ncbi:hypothetical protein [Pontibacter mucosus]|uniref:hypothetical protein n=1 Tax=Pontibacter mucosus TaxID=1649266 RepID=UPI0011B272F0|nr:hypothetical protein [Pontibacter mucosus]
MKLTEVKYSAKGLMREDVLIDFTNRTLAMTGVQDAVAAYSDSYIPEPSIADVRADSRESRL